MTVEQCKGAIDLVAYGITVMSGSIGIKYLINAIKYFILYVMPLFKKTKTESDVCSYHNAIDSIVLEFREQGKTVIRIETKLEEFFHIFDKQEKINEEVFSRLREVEKMAGILDDRHKLNRN